MRKSGNRSTESEQSVRPVQVIGPDEVAAEDVNEDCREDVQSGGVFTISRTSDGSYVIRSASDV